MGSRRSSGGRGISISMIIFWGMVGYFLFSGDDDKKEVKVVEQDPPAITESTETETSIISEEAKESLNKAKKEFIEAGKNIANNLKDAANEVKKDLVKKSEEKEQIEPYQAEDDKPKETMKPIDNNSNKEQNKMKKL